MQPQDIDTVFYVSAIEKSRLDQDYKNSLGRWLKHYPLDRVYSWNGCLINLVEAYQFPKDDIVVLKIEWQNITNKALYLHVNQYKVFVANKEFPVTARQQRSALLYPGQMDIVYLFIQGYGLSCSNAFELMLPPDSDAVRKVLSSN
jgi:hypothetical protein